MFRWRINGDCVGGPLPTAFTATPTHLLLLTIWPLLGKMASPERFTDILMASTHKRVPNNRLKRYSLELIMVSFPLIKLRLFRDT